MDLGSVSYVLFLIIFEGRLMLCALRIISFPNVLYIFAIGGKIIIIVEFFTNYVHNVITVLFVF